MPLKRLIIGFKIELYRFFETEIIFYFLFNYLELQTIANYYKHTKPKHETNIINFS